MDEPPASCIMVHYRVNASKCHLACKFYILQGNFLLTVYLHACLYTLLKFCLLFFSQMILLWNRFLILSTVIFLRQILYSFLLWSNIIWNGDSQSHIIRQINVFERKSSRQSTAFLNLQYISGLWCVVYYPNIQLLNNKTWYSTCIRVLNNNTLMRRQNGRHFPEGIFVNENVLISITHWLKFVPIRVQLTTVQLWFR